MKPKKQGRRKVRRGLVDLLQWHNATEPIDPSRFGGQLLLPCKMRYMQDFRRSRASTTGLVQEDREDSGDGGISSWPGSGMSRVQQARNHCRLRVAIPGLRVSPSHATESFCSSQHDKMPLDTAPWSGTSIVSNPAYQSRIARCQLGLQYPCGSYESAGSAKLVRWDMCCMV